MRSLFLCNSTYGGGAERYVVDLARGLAARGHACFVGAPPGSPVFDAAVAAPEVEAIPFDLGPKLARRSALDLALRWRGYRRLAQSFLDDVVSAHGIDIVHLQFKKEQLLVTPAAAALGIPVVWTEHGQLPRLFALAPLALRRYLRAAADTRSILCVSDFVRHDLATHGVSGAKLQVCYNGVAIPRPARPADRARVRRTLGLEPRHFAVGCTARLVRLKGHRFLLEAAARARLGIPDLRIVLIGDGPERQSLELLALQLDLRDAVSFLGMRPDARELLPAFEVFAMPSLSEGMPLALLEAMAAGMPVIGTRVGGIPEALDDGAAGVLVAPGCSKPLEIALERLHEQPALRSELGTTARQRVIEWFSRDAMIDGTEAAFLEAGAPAVPVVANAS